MNMELEGNDVIDPAITLAAHYTGAESTHVRSNLCAEARAWQHTCAAHAGNEGAGPGEGPKCGLAHSGTRQP